MLLYKRTQETAKILKQEAVRYAGLHWIRGSYYLRNGDVGCHGYKADYKAMSSQGTTFLEFPLERDLYFCKPLHVETVPLRVLITAAGTKMAYCLVYKICKGEVFGPHQEVYIHLVNQKGHIDHKSMYLEFVEVGFHLVLGFVVSGDPEEVYKDVDVAIIIPNTEEHSGLSYSEMIATGIIRGRQLLKNIQEYSRPTVRLVVGGSSTKTNLIYLLILHRLEPKFPPENMSAVVIMEEAVARANLAARLKTTTDKIKNIVIWGKCCPDVMHATVRMLPPGDCGATEEVDIPVREALQDDNYLQNEFVQSVYRRRVHPAYGKKGKSVAVAIARHLKALFQGTANDEIFSMGVITPVPKPFLFPEGLVFAYPVKAKHGKWQIMEDIKYDVRTHLNMIETVNRIPEEQGTNSILRAIDYARQLEESQNDIIQISQRHELTRIIKPSRREMQFYISGTPYENPQIIGEKVHVQKSIAWGDEENSKKDDDRARKSSIRFSFNDSRKTESKTLINAQDTKDTFVLPPINQNSKRRIK